MTDRPTPDRAEPSTAIDRIRAVLQGCSHHFEDEPLFEEALAEARASGAQAVPPLDVGGE